MRFSNWKRCMQRRNDWQTRQAKEAGGWRTRTAPFFWPVFVESLNMQPVLFASDTMD